jgi:ribose 5-phosphate isomerase B
MRIAVGSDHRGVSLKASLVELLNMLHHDVVDVGTTTAENVDYPDYAEKVGRLVAAGDAQRGILICGTGIGMAIAANKVPGIRAAPCHDETTAELSRRHNDLNVLCLSADGLGAPLADRIVQKWLTTDFEAGRHARRVGKITRIEGNQGAPPDR